jgi:hypothetical protein
VSIKWRCDGDQDCANGFDEIDCLPRNCSKSEFRCKNGRCIANSSVCDHIDDCRDMSDEICRKYQKFRSARFDMTDSLSYLHTRLRHLTVQLSADRQCLASEFRCHKGGCISLQWHCDQQMDCQDGSDELDCGKSDHDLSSVALLNTLSHHLSFPAAKGLIHKTQQKNLLNSRILRFFPSLFFLPEHFLVFRIRSCSSIY